MDFATAIKTCFSKYVTFSGRASRSEYWYFALFTVILMVIASVIDTAIGLEVFGLIVALALLLPTFAVAARRLHDRDKSAWWLLLYLLPLIGPVIMLVWFCSKGTDGPNQFGADPLSAESNAVRAVN